MISIPHPLVAKVEQEYRVLESLIMELPKLYNNIAVEIEKRAEADAEAASDGDSEVYLTVYNSYHSVIEFTSEVPISANGYLLAAIYAFYERNVKEAYKVLGITTNKVYPKVAFLNCNIPVEPNQKLYDHIDMMRMVRDNQSHGQLKSAEEMDTLMQFVRRYKSLQMVDGIVTILDSRVLLNALERINDFFRMVFKTNTQFATRYIGGSNTQATSYGVAFDGGERE